MGQISSRINTRPEMHCDKPYTSSPKRIVRDRRRAIITVSPLTVIPSDEQWGSPNSAYKRKNFEPLCSSLESSRRRRTSIRISPISTQLCNEPCLRASLASNTKRLREPRTRPRRASNVYQRLLFLEWREGRIGLQRARS